MEITLYHPGDQRRINATLLHEDDVCVCARVCLCVCAFSFIHVHIFASCLYLYIFQALRLKAGTK